MRREAHARYISSTNVEGWEEYAKVRQGVWEDVVKRTNEYFDSGIEQLWVEIKGIMGKRTREADMGIATLGVQGDNTSTSKALS